MKDPRLTREEILSLMQASDTSKPREEVVRLLAVTAKAKIDEMLAPLTYREREILKLRYGLGDGYVYSLEDVARIFVITPQRVRAIQVDAERKLHAAHSA